ncbi:replication factor C subunit 4-like [Paramacrobiotus metropolitanus]|uniref:replication factor C subunit 4-like n=1 Tax=Paramacrobiotus metropolitanus TaxID=2943436 RepID=UPI002445BA5C|nr:replication factor C subunit 4-like [Paramacrobiotus metropolitanus]
MDKFLQKGKTSGSGDASSSKTTKRNSPSKKDSQPGASTSGKSESQFSKFFAPKSTNAVKKSLPWVDKYRPKSVEEIAFQTDVVAVLRNALKGNEFPHFLFYGPPGTGKTSAILAVCRELFGMELMKERILELNASDERGIGVVREKVKTFAQYSSSPVRPDGKPCPPFKVIILDEADSMTQAAQAALRRIMEKESKNTRFCLICNYVSKIIEPLVSRCARFRFKPLPTSVMKERLQYIAAQENVKIESKALDALIGAADGDLRRAVTLLQSISRLMKDEQITKDDVLELTGYIPDEEIITLVDTCKLGNYDHVQAFVQQLIYAGYGAGQLFSQLEKQILENDNLSGDQKASIIERIAIADHRLMDGADEFLQIMDVGGAVMTALA